MLKNMQNCIDVLKMRMRKQCVRGQEKGYKSKMPVEKFDELYEKQEMETAEFKNQ